MTGAKSGALRDVKVNSKHFKAISILELTSLVRYEEDEGVYTAGDLIRVKEWGANGEFTGSAIIVEVTHCLREKGMVIPGTVILSIRLRVSEI